VLALLSGITAAVIASTALALLIVRGRRRTDAPAPLVRVSARRVSEEQSEARPRGAGAVRRGKPLVEILSFDGCPNHLGAIALVERVSGELGLEPEIKLVEVPDREAARRLRFLGSPTIRVGGRDVDPDTGERSDYALSCRVFRTEAGIAGQPDERWVREALRREAQVG
jgi:hypothetical protein